MLHLCIFEPMEAFDILNSHNLKRTRCREGIIEAIMTTSHALSENEIKEQLSGKYDRTTFYRSFKTLQEHKIIHKIVVDNQTIKYALDTIEPRQTEHAHFYCNNCHQVQCLECAPVQNIQLPDGYSEEKTEILVKGTCPMCRQ